MIRIFVVILALLGSGLWSGASRSSETEVLATVNGVSISKGDVESALKIGMKYEGMPADEDTKKLILNMLIENYLIRAKLNENGALSSPDLRAMLAQSERNTLRNYFFAETFQKPEPPTSEEVDEFIKGHMNLFSGRQVFKYIDLKFKKSPRIDIHVIKGYALHMNEKIKGGLQVSPNGPELTQILSYLVSVNQPFVTYRGFKESEQINSKILSILEAAKQNEIIIDGDADADSYHLVVKLWSEPDPIEVDLAKVAVRDGLLKERANVAAQEAMAKLKADAKIQYTGK